MEKSERKLSPLSIGILVLILILSGLWAMNLKNIWNLNPTPSTPADDSAWESLKNDLNRSLQSARGRLDDANRQENEIRQAAGTSLLSDILKNVRPATSTITATGTLPVATGTLPVIATNTKSVIATTAPAAIKK